MLLHARPLCVVCQVLQILMCARHMCILVSHVLRVSADTMASFMTEFAQLGGGHEMVARLRIMRMGGLAHTCGVTEPSFLGGLGCQPARVCSDKL